MLIPVDYAQANFRYTGVGAPTGAEWTLGYNIELFSGTPAQAAEALAIAYAAADLDQYHTTETTLAEIEVKFGPNDLGPAGTWPAAIAGTASAPTVTPQVSALVQKVTGVGGRTGRGRIYFPGIPEAQVSGGGILSNAWIDGLTIAFNAMSVDTSGDGLVPALLHGVDSPVSAPYLITSFNCDIRCATQRRRNRR